MLVLETPNPESLLAGSVNFHRDPTHLRPVHPDTLAFLCESAGFADVEILRLSPVPGHRAAAAARPRATTRWRDTSTASRAPQRHHLRLAGLRRRRPPLAADADPVGRPALRARDRRRRRDARPAPRHPRAPRWAGPARSPRPARSDHVTWANALRRGGRATRTACGCTASRWARATRAPRRAPRRRSSRGGRATPTSSSGSPRRLVAGLQAFLEGSDHDLRVFAPYLFGTTICGAPRPPPGAAPCCRACTTSPTRAWRSCATCWRRGARLPVQRAGGGAPGAPALPRSATAAWWASGFDPPDGPAAGRRPPRARPRALPRLRRAPGGGQARPRGGGARPRARARARRTRPALVLMGSGGYRPPRVRGGRGAGAGLRVTRTTSAPSTPARSPW